MQKANDISLIKNDLDACKAIEESVKELCESFQSDKGEYTQVKFDKQLIDYIKLALNPRYTNFISLEYSEKDKKTYNDIWTKAIKAMDPKSIRKASVLLPYKAMLWDYYYGEDVVRKVDSLEGKLLKKGEQELINVTDGSLVNLELTEITSSDELLLEGFDYVNSLGPNFEIIVTDVKGNAFKPEVKGWYRRDRFNFIGEKVCSSEKFKFIIPIKKSVVLKFVVTDGTSRVVLRPVFGNFSKFNGRVRGEFFYDKNHMVKLTAKSRFIVGPDNAAKRMWKEIKYMGRLAKRLKLTALRLRIRCLFGTLFHKKPIWIFRDNEKRAKDSGIVMFKKFKEYKDHDKINAYFILDRNSEDYELVKSYGKVIQPHTMKYMSKCLQAEMLIDTRGSINPRYIFGGSSLFVRDLCKWNYIWMIHGVMTRNESTWTGKFDINAKLYATCGERECEAVMDPNNGYGYEDGEAQITGLPRHDALTHDKEKNILFMPTWRKEYAGDLIPGTSDRQYVPNFKESEYYKFYNKLINDERLLKAMREKGYDGDFYLHPSFMKQWEDFDGNDCIKVANKPADTNKAISKCSLMITDFSSAAFDAAYLDTPVVYTQYDIDTFGERHTGKDGYFEYERDGFGKVCVDYDDAVNEIVRYIENDCVMEDKYKERVNQFFVHKDGNSSMRVYEAIDKIKNK